MFTDGERIEAIDTTPASIVKLFATPYHWSSRVIPRGVPILEVGGGAQRLGKKILNAVDVDYSAECENDYTSVATSLPFKDRKFHSTICFETIEHIETPLRVVEELMRVTSNQVFISSVNLDGPNFVDGAAIWKRKDNPFHISEMGHDEFCNLFRGLRTEFYGIMRENITKDFVIVEGLHKLSYSNIVRILLL